MSTEEAPRVNPELVITTRGVIFLLSGFSIFGFGLIFDQIVLILPSALVITFFAYSLISLIRFANTSFWFDISVASTTIRAKNFLVFRASVFSDSDMPIRGVLSVDVSDGLFPLLPAKSFVKVSLEKEGSLSAMYLSPFRGKEYIESVSFHFGGLFGFFFARVRSELEIPIYVMPEPQRISLPWTVKQRILDDLIAEISIPIRGRGTDFLSLKDFEFGDEIRHIHWRASAKHQKLISKEFEEPKQLRFLIIVDASSSMAGPKLEFALSAAVELASALRRSTHSFSVLIHSDKTLRLLSPGHSIQALHRLELELYDVQPDGEYFNFEELRNYISTRRLEDSVVILISDLELDPAEVKTGLTLLMPIVNHLFYLPLFTPGFGTLAYTKVREKTQYRKEETNYRRTIIEPLLYLKYNKRAADYESATARIKGGMHVIMSYETNILLELHTLLRKTGRSTRTRATSRMRSASGSFSQVSNDNAARLLTSKSTFPSSRIPSNENKKMRQPQEAWRYEGGMKK